MPPQTPDYGDAKPIVPGNIQWYGRQRVPMPNGYGTVFSESREEDGLEVLYPRIYDGKLHSSEEAWQHYKQTGQHMGKFRSSTDADKFGQKYHEDAAAGKYEVMPQETKFDVEAARKAGYSDDEILSHLTATRKFDVEGATKQGYSKADIIQYLSSSKPADTTPPAKPKAPQEYSRIPMVLPGGGFSFQDVPKGEEEAARKANLAGTERGGRYGIEMLGTAAGGELGGAAGAAYKLGRAGRIVTSAAGFGAGAATSDVAADIGQGKKPDIKKSLLKGGVAAGTSVALDVGGSAVSKFLEPFLTKAPLPAAEEALASQVSGKASDLVKLADAEEGIRASVTAAPKAIREQVIKQAYSGLQGEIDLMPIGETAEAASEKMLAHGTPPSMARVIKITRAIKAAEGEVMDLINEGDADRGELEGAAKTLMQLEQRAKVPIGDAIQLRSALGRVLATARRAHAPGEAQLVPGEVYQAVKTVKGELDKAIEGVATAQGKEGYLKMADKLYSTFMNDFYNAGAPLRGVTNLKPQTTGKTLDSLLKPENVNRAITALNRWGMKEQAAALQKVADLPDRAEAVKEMKDLLTSPSSYTARTTGALREQDAARVKSAVEALQKARMDRIKLAGGIVGVGTSIEALRRTIALGRSSRARHIQ